MPKLPITFNQLAFLALSIAIAPLAQAVPLPPVGAHAEATAKVPGNDDGTVTNDGATVASASNIAVGSGIADAFAQATVGGEVRSRSLVDSASGLAQASNAAAVARWTGQFQTAGIDPGNPIDLDLVLDIDGMLSYSNNNANVGLDDLLSSVTFSLTLHDVLSGATSVFDGSASLSSISRFDPPDFDRGGDWADSSRDSDFTIPFCGAFSCQVDVDALISVDDALLVGFGATFGVEVELFTSAFQAQGQETGASSDFANTASVNLSTDTPGISFEPVPEPGTGLLLGLGLSLLGFTRRSG
jgi:hypothetical protein